MTAAERLAAGQPPLRVSELAKLLGCSVSYLHKLISAGTLRAGRVGNRYAVPTPEAAKLAREAGALSP